jgi:hypothetical protein
VAEVIVFGESQNRIGVGFVGGDVNFSIGSRFVLIDKILRQAIQRGSIRDLDAPRIVGTGARGRANRKVSQKRDDSRTLGWIG